MSQPMRPVPAVLVRHAVAADLDDLLPLLAGDGAAALPSRDDLAAMLDGADTAVLVAQPLGTTEDPALVGLALLRVRDSGGVDAAAPRRRVRIEALQVARAHRGGGIGRALLARAGAWGAARHAPAIEIAGRPAALDRSVRAGA
jgi:ribosomal protein S18 acetylase RimI-like enzyme